MGHILYPPFFQSVHNEHCNSVFWCIVLFNDYTIMHVGFSGGSVKSPPANSGDAGNWSPIPALGRSPGEGNGNPFQYSCHDNVMDRGA